MIFLLVHFAASCCYFPAGNVALLVVIRLLKAIVTAAGYHTMYYAAAGLSLVALPLYYLAE